MANKITKELLTRLIRETISEAYDYDKEHRQYIPKYSGNPKKDAGVLTAFGKRNDYNYARNEYQWQDKERAKRFKDLQFEKGLDKDDDPMYGNQEHNDAEDYLDKNSEFVKQEKAMKALNKRFKKLIEKFIEVEVEKYPILKQEPKSMIVNDLIRYLKNQDFDYLN